MRAFAAFLFMASVQAFACPNLTGTYTCTSKDGKTSTITLAQAQVNGQTVYNYNGSNLPTDNHVYPVPDSDTIKNGTFRSWCDGDKALMNELLGKYYNQNDYFGDLTLDISYTVDANKDLNVVTTGKIKNSGGQYPINSTSVCKHN